MTPAERQAVVDAAYAELVERFPLPQGPTVIRDLDDLSDWCRSIGSERRRWVEAHRDDFAQIMRRMLAGESAEPLQGSLL